MNKKLIIIISIIICLLSCNKENNNKLHIIFPNVDGVNENTIVKKYGVEIGGVSKMQLWGDGVLVDIILEKNQTVPKGSSFEIVSPALAATTIVVEPSKNKANLSNTDTVNGTYLSKGILDTLFADSTNRQKAKEVIEKIKDGLEKLSKKDTLSN